MKRTILIFMFALPVIIGSRLRAESYKGLTEIGIQGGGILFEGNSNLREGGVYGARFEHYFTDHWAEGISVLAGQVDVKNPSPSDSNSGNEAKILIPTWEGQYHFGNSAIRPFVAIGFGDLRVSPVFAVNTMGYDPSNTDSLIVTYGGGLKWLLKHDMVARLDARGIVNTTAHTPTWGSKNSATLTAGLSWVFGNCGETKVAETSKVIDSDGDGVPDDKDACPGTPPGAKVDERGCVVMADSDGDGVPDDKDACPGTPAGVKVDDKGCPLDSDGDGVPDYKDKCPGTPPGVKVDENGCPSEASKAVPQAQWVLSGVTFESNSNKLTASASTELDKAVEILKANPTVRVEVQGHTDNTGKADYNLQLSEGRTKAVKDYLVSKGISADRLQTKGYGDAQPIADNKTKDGRAKNRRIEFKVLSR